MNQLIRKLVFMTRRDAGELIITCVAFWVIAAGVMLIQRGAGW